MQSPGLSKSRVIAGAQCAKRLYLQVHRPELAEISADSERRFAAGHAVGALAQAQFPKGALIDNASGLNQSLQETEAALRKRGEVTLFEATMRYEGVLVRCDILNRSSRGLRLIEVKSTGEVKDSHLLDVAVQAWVLEGAGYHPSRIEVAHIDKGFVYRGDGDYRGLFRYTDVKGEIRPLVKTVPGLIRRLRETLKGREPKVTIGKHCAGPYECEFMAHCWPRTRFPVTLLPNGRELIWQLIEDGYQDLRKVPVSRLKTAHQRWVHAVTRRGKPDLKPGAAEAFDQLRYPARYLDFETLNPPVPLWEGWRPFEVVPFQWSCHTESRDGSVRHEEFLHDGSDDPSRAFIESLLSAVSTQGAIYVYGSYEKTVLTRMAARYPKHRSGISKVIDRLVNIIPIVHEHYYHPDMSGSWSLKAVLPTLAPQLAYERLEGVQDGNQAQEAYRELIAEHTPRKRRTELRASLLEYCKLDTLGTLEIVRFLRAVP